MTGKKENFFGGGELVILHFQLFSAICKKYSTF